MTKTTYTGEEVKAMLKERGILHQDAAQKLGILPQNFSARLHGEFTDIECNQMGILPTLKQKYAFEKDLKTVIQYYWDEFVEIIVETEYDDVIDEIVHEIKKAHCKTIEVWDYKEEMKPTSVEPTSVEPTSVEPTSGEPTSVEPTSVEPTSVEPTSVEPTSGEPKTFRLYHTLVQIQALLSDTKRRKVLSSNSRYSATPEGCRQPAGSAGATKRKF